MRAKRIVAFRAERGGFRTIRDLEELPGMPRGWTEKIRPYVVEGEPGAGGVKMRSGEER